MNVWHNSSNTMENLSLLFKIECANEVTCYSWYSYVQHTTHDTKLWRLFSLVSWMLFAKTLKYTISIQCLICITMCSYASTRAESVNCFWKTINYSADGGDKSILCIFIFLRYHGDCKNTNGKFILVTLTKTIIHVHKSNIKWTHIHE